MSQIDLSVPLTFPQTVGQSEEHINWLSDEIGVHNDMLPAYLSMKTAAGIDGIKLEIISGFRSFERQKSIWNRKLSGQLTVNNINDQAIAIKELPIQKQIKSVLLYSALPGASRHHWGSDIDVYCPDMLPSSQGLQLKKWEYQSGGPFHLLSEWLNANASKFGFFFPYKQYQNGIAEEPWHLSYRPIADMYQALLTEKSLKNIIEKSDLLYKDDVVTLLHDIYVNYITNICQDN